LLFVAVTVFVLRLSPAAAMLCAWLGAFYGMFQHFNIRTPCWLGFVIQRPEAHAEHHRCGVHAHNYSDLPLWDLLAGSWRNPRDFHGDALGFGQSNT
jgi:sterol desaturase/sphingolipid hydroxylase (fatty acid hydroxylase superfamily)